MERPDLRVRGKIFAIEKRGDGRISLWCKAEFGSQMVLVGADPERFFVPPYVGSKGWIGMRLDSHPDWDEVAEVVQRSYRLIAPKRLVTLLGYGVAPIWRRSEERTVGAGAMITPDQCLQARKLLGWTPERLAGRCESSSTTIRLFEKGERPISAEGLASIRCALEAAGVEFIPENGGGPRVRLRIL